MKLVFFGHGTRGALCLDALLRADFDVAAIVGQPGINDELSNASPLRQCARDHDIAWICPATLKHTITLRTLARFDADLFILAGYTKILPPSALALARRGCINLHGGRLPQYRGGSPINWQIINGELRGACTILYADEGIDTGPVIASEEFLIGPDETAGDITDKTLRIFPPLLVRVLRELEADTAVATPQDLTAGSYYVKRYPEDGAIDWSRLDDQQVHNLVRGLTGPGLPGAFCRFGRRKVAIRSSRRLAETVLGPAGRIGPTRGDGVVVICRNRGLLVESVEIDGEILPARAVLKRREKRQCTK
ncbi:MAG: methionyl-tRNA formyltransferase [Planctomycetota bacterium]